MVLAFNVGGSKTKVGISKDGDTFTDFWTFETPSDFDKWIEMLQKGVAEKLSEKKIDFICGGIAGVWDVKKTKIFKSPNLSDWEKIPIKKHLEVKFDGKVFLDNDVVMEGLGEAKLGAGRRKQIMVFLAIGTGIGGVKIENGKISPMVYGSEPGQQIIESDGEVGYWEDFASGEAMYRMYGKRPEEIDDQTIWDDELRLLAIGVHNIIMMWSPEIIVFGGGISQRIDLKSLEKLIKVEMRMFPKLPEMVMSELGDKAGIYGALEYLKINL